MLSQNVPSPLCALNMNILKIKLKSFVWILLNLQTENSQETRQARGFSYVQKHKEDKRTEHAGYLLQSCNDISFNIYINYWYSISIIISIGHIYTHIARKQAIYRHTIRQQRHTITHSPPLGRVQRVTKIKDGPNLVLLGGRIFHDNRLVYTVAERLV